MAKPPPDGLAITTSPGLQRGAQVASLQSLILRLARWQLTPTSLGMKAENPGGYTRGAAPPCSAFFTHRGRGNHLTSGTRLPTLKGMATLPNNISNLSAAEKFELLDALWEDLESHAPALSSDQAEELDRRIAAYEKNPPTGTPWEQVKAGLPKR